jgi:hypothetical protein
MIVLSQTTDNLQVVLGGAITTNQLECMVSWRDRTSTTFTADRTVTTKAAMFLLALFIRFPLMCLAAIAGFIVGHKLSKR